MIDGETIQLEIYVFLIKLNIVVSVISFLLKQLVYSFRNISFLIFVFHEIKLDASI